MGHRHAPDEHSERGGRVRGKSAANFRRTFDARLDVIRAVVVAARAEEVTVASENAVLCDIRRELREGGVAVESS